MTGEPPVVLVPGCGRDQHAFDALVAGLPGRDVRVVCLPGRGGIAGPAPSTASEAARFVVAGMDAAGLGRVVVGGHSYGGAIAIEVALAAPERVAGLLLIDTGARLRAHPDILAGAEAAALADEANAANLADWRACHAFDRLADVCRIEAPTLVVVGEEDVLTPVRYARYLRDKIRGARVVTIPGADHEAPTTHAAEIGLNIAAFLDSLRADPRSPR